MNLQLLWSLIKDSINAWIDDYAPSMGAALAYYTVFSLAPLLLIVIAVAGAVFGQDAVRGEIFAQLSGQLGPEIAAGVQQLVEERQRTEEGIPVGAFGRGAAIVGATTVFAELQSDLDRIWRVEAEPMSGWLSFLRARFLSFGLVLGLGFLMLVSLVIAAALTALGKWYGSSFAGWEVILHTINTAVSIALSAALFAMIYKFMPRASVAWRDVGVGATVTALLFELGKFLISLYIGEVGLTSGFGAAGSLVLLIVWVYYSAQIFLLGAEFTWVYARTCGSHSGRGAPAPPMLHR
jgi:membrane protein